MTSSDARVARPLGLGLEERLRSRLATWAIPMGLFVVAATIRLIVAMQLPFPTTEPSAYYVGVAENLVTGQGLVSDAVWSYATEPLTLPKPAFELWLPMSSFISAAAMLLLGPSFWAAQVGGAIVGALIAPLTWAVAAEAARAQGLDARRSRAVALAAGLLAAVLSPFLLASVVPDSYVPYVVATLAAALIVPRLLGAEDGQLASPPRRPRALVGLALGLALGVAYLSRQEVIWLGATVLLMLWWALRARPRGQRAREAVASLWPVVVGGLLVVVPWLVRNQLAFGSFFPGQAIENAFLVRNEDIFAFAERPNLAAYLGQGLATILGNPVTAARQGLVEVILIPAFPVGLVGLAALWGLRRSRAVRGPTALQALLISGALTFVAIVLLFPVASLWGTFAHASGPLIVALTVTSVLGGDALLARISRIRRWSRPNVIVAPIGLLAMSLVLAGFQVAILARQSAAAEARVEGVARALEQHARSRGLEVPATIITDHPMWLASALDRRALALPHEDLDSVVELSRHFDAPWVALVDEGGKDPAGLLSTPAHPCLASPPVDLVVGGDPAWLVVLDPGCGET